MRTVPLRQLRDSLGLELQSGKRLLVTLRGQPIAAIVTPREALLLEQFEATGSLAEMLENTRNL